MVWCEREERGGYLRGGAYDTPQQLTYIIVRADKVGAACLLLGLLAARGHRALRVARSATLDTALHLGAVLALDAGRRARLGLLRGGPGLAARAGRALGVAGGVALDVVQTVGPVLAREVDRAASLGRASPAG